MQTFFVFAGVFLFIIAVFLYVAPNRRILNFVNYDAASTPSQINRYAAARLLLPTLVFFTCAFIIRSRPELAVPLVFPSMMSILVAVVWIAAGVSRLKR